MAYERISGVRRAQEGQCQGSRMPGEARLCRWWPAEPVPWKSRCATLNHFLSNYSGADSCNCCLSFPAICDASLHTPTGWGQRGTSGLGDPIAASAVVQISRSLTGPCLTLIGIRGNRSSKSEAKSFTSPLGLYETRGK